MFELLSFVKQNGVPGNAEVAACIEKSFEHYENMMAVEDQRQKALLENIEKMRESATFTIEGLRMKIENLFQQHSKQVTAHMEVCQPIDELVCSCFCSCRSDC